VRVGDAVQAGELLGTLYAASDEVLDDGEARLRRALHVSAERVTPPPLVHEI